MNKEGVVHTNTCRCTHNRILFINKKNNNKEIKIILKNKIKNPMDISELKNDLKNSVDEVISRMEEKISALQEKKVEIPNLTQRRKLD